MTETKRSNTYRVIFLFSKEYGLNDEEYAPTFDMSQSRSRPKSDRSNAYTYVDDNFRLSSGASNTYDNLNPNFTFSDNNGVPVNIKSSLFKINSVFINHFNIFSFYGLMK